MGGIIGKLSFDHSETLALPALEQMLDALRHRGAVGSGFYVHPGIALGWCGHERSPITRPAVATNEDETVHVVADASLSNRSSLWRELAGSHLIRGRSDADVIAHAYEEWGDECVEHLHGPFACAIWDGTRERLLLARDRIGVRPLFFAVLHGHGIVFASAIRALLHDPGVGREWCPQAIDAYLTLGYVPAPLTIYQRISKLEPAQRLIVDGRRLHLDQYWDFPIPGSQSRGGDDAADEIGMTLGDAIRATQPDGSAAGALYSGGVASTALIAAAPAHLPAIGVILDRDATETARRINAARRLGVQAILDGAAIDATAVAPQIAAHFDEPLADPAAVAQYSTLVTAAAHAATALAGHGAATLWRSPHQAATRPMVWDAHERRAIYTRTFAWQVRDADVLARHRDLVARRRNEAGIAGDWYVEARTVLPDSVLVIAERAALAAGLDLRFPFLEDGMVTLACSVYRSGRASDRPAEWLERFLARRLPSDLLPRTDDVAGSARPIPRRRTYSDADPHLWLTAAATAMVPDLLLTRRFDGRGIVSRPALQQLWDDHASGRRDHSRHFWSLLMLEFWFRQFIDGDAAADKPYEYAILRAA